MEDEEREEIDATDARDGGIDLLERIWAANDLTEVEAGDLAVEAQHRTRGSWTIQSRSDSCFAVSMAWARELRSSIQASMVSHHLYSHSMSSSLSRGTSLAGIRQ